MHIAEIFQEQHSKHIVFVNAGVNATSKGVASFPNCIVDVFLSYFGHGIYFTALIF
jgi:hypothetical protein